MLSVIIPTLNEARSLPSLLGSLSSQRNIALEIIVADGGSEDETVALARDYGARVTISPSGRGRQMNVAAHCAAGDYLLFLHADSHLEDDGLLSRALLALEEEIQGSSRTAVAGHFPLRFIRQNSDLARAYRYAEEKTAFNRTNTTNGDQGLLLRRDFFFALGGFDESLPYLEDQRIAEKIRREGVLITLPGEIRTSARRFEREGFHRRYTLMSIMMGMHSIGEEGFFRQAPRLYQLQGETTLLSLTPYFALIRQMMRREWGVAGSFVRFYRLGRYIRQNSWQLFYFFDIWMRPLLGAGRYPCLKLHDRVFAPLTDLRIFDALSGLLCYLWFMVILAGYYRWDDWRRSL